MNSFDTLNKLQLRMCELKLEKRRVDTEIKNMLNCNKSIDFFAAKRLSTERNSIKNSILHVEGQMFPNDIA